MKVKFLLCLLFLQVIHVSGQTDTRVKKYPSLLWEISGKGLKKPSYLIGTMHVSNKMAFNLPDSFYYALRSAQMVALETNPETWQEDMDRYDLSGGGYLRYGSMYGGYSEIPSDYLGINTLKFYRYNKKVERALYSNPAAINNLLYRSYGNESSDFEEDTYLDMYIFQCGRKWGKKVAGVEDYGESMRLMAEAYKDAAKDKSKKERSYGDWDEAYSTDKLQEAYRRGNLDLLDTINKYNSFSAAFDEKFLYRRNEIQAHSIDSIIRSGTILFVGVGAAHLPGDRGVIEILRRKGYKLRPVKMGERASREKDLVDKIRVPVQFRTDSSEDGMFRVDIPGRFYKFGEDLALDQKQCADMANGSYYLVTRIMTNAWMWNHSPDDVYRVVDSLLYENIPGKIIARQNITRYGYKGFDITNRTRRGDLQRYQIFVTPFEVIFFKISGNGEYVKNGPEADRFFNSIQLKEYKPLVNGNKKKYMPPYGGFAVEFPHEPYIGNDGSWIYDAADHNNGMHYRVIRTDVHNFHFAEEDSFDLALMEESFMASEFVDSQYYRQYTTHKGYPALDGKYRDKKGAVYHTRFLIQGPHYYTLIARARQEMPQQQQFIQSFECRPFQYGNTRTFRDTALYYSVNTSWYPESRKIKIDIPQYSRYGREEEEEEPTEKDLLETGLMRSKVIRNDSTGEKVYVTFFRASRYLYLKDSSIIEKENRSNFFTDSTYVIRSSRKNILPDETRVWESIVSDTGSSRTLRTKILYKDGKGYSITVQGDTLTAPSSFVQQFFDNFSPADTLKGVDLFQKKSAVFFADLNSTDSVRRTRALNSIEDIYLDSTDMPELVRSIRSLNWEQNKYLETKKGLINKFSHIKTKEAAIYLRNLYMALDDTIQLQYAVLENLLMHKTRDAYKIFGEIVSNEAPVLDFAGDDYSSYRDFSIKRLMRNYQEKNSFKNGKFLDELDDSLELTRTILPDLLPLLNLQDYKEDIMSLLGQMVDSNLLKPADYDVYFSKFLVEAKQELKKQSIAEKKRAIEKAEEIKKDQKKAEYMSDDDEDDGNEDLGLYANLLLPFADSRADAVKPVIQQMLRSGDKRLRYNTFLQLVKKGMQYPDTLLNYFAGLDEYRFELYYDLKQAKLEKLFPKMYVNQSSLSRSELLFASDSRKPDSLVYLQSMEAAFKGKKGLMHFYKYKVKKDDLAWKLGVVGLLPTDTTKYDFEKSTVLKTAGSNMSDYDPVYDFTEMTNRKIKDDQPLEMQLKKALKKLLYSRRNSAMEFYKEEDAEQQEEDF